MADLLQPDSLQTNFSKFAKALGIIGGLSGVLAGVAFVIGYIAIKSFDEMLGIPSSTTLEETYVRTGLMFIPNTVHHMTAFFYSLQWPLFLSLAGLVLVSVFMSWLIGWPHDWSHSEKFRLSLVVVVNFTLIYGLAVYLPDHVSPNHPQNKGLAFRNMPDVEESGDDLTQGDSETITIDDLGKKVNDALVGERSNRSILEMYGKYAAATMLVLLLLPVWFSWAKKLSAERDELDQSSAKAKKDPNYKSCVKASLHTVQVGGILPLIIAAVVMAISLPANYGVMVLNGATICGEVQYWQKKAKPDDASKNTNSGYLLSDMSNPKEPVVFLETQVEEDGKCANECQQAMQRGPVFKLIQFDREKEIEFVRLWRCREGIFSDWKGG